MAYCLYLQSYLEKLSTPIFHIFHNSISLWVLSGELRLSSGRQGIWDLMFNSNILLSTWCRYQRYEWYSCPENKNVNPKFRCFFTIFDIFEMLFLTKALRSLAYNEIFCDSHTLMIITVQNKFYWTSRPICWSLNQCKPSTSH